MPRTFLGTHSDYCFAAVRLILEPTNTVYCRTVDLSDKDTFAEQVITKPRTPMVRLERAPRTSASDDIIFLGGGGD